MKIRVNFNNHLGISQIGCVLDNAKFKDKRVKSIVIRTTNGDIQILKGDINTFWNE